MRVKLVVFPIRGRNWCFSRSIDPSIPADQSSKTTPSTFKHLCNKIFSSSENSENASDDSKVELVVDFVAGKMNGAWTKLEQAPQGTLKNRIHGLGLKLLSRVKPSEILFKSIPKETDRVDIVYPSSLNPRLVRRRLRYIAFRGSVVHKKFLYGSAILLPLTSVFMVLPLPNIPFFWILFRTYSHWRASQGSEKLLHLVSDASCRQQSVEAAKEKEKLIRYSDPWVCFSTYFPSDELQKLLHCSEDANEVEGVGDRTISKICEKFYLNSTDVVKYRNSVY
ncbi:uncharacterized protein c23h3.12c [Phtheirospermum japonicum]|uniref:Uncharacterized protein c23h3.12c n=1 Tax=Phtheirospermum japonicum TaxID=374723 RepID=A0A830DBT0_9LAMI|nr:uncharacterized protein c23h3.12c [Phtheirospermum japonicum]